MWLNDELFAKMYLKSTENQNLELKRAKERNIELSKRHQKLQEEKELLDGKLKLNQVGIVTEKNYLNNLQERLINQKKLNMELAQRLRISNEQIDVAQSCIDKMATQHEDSLSVLEPMHEKLSFKSNVVECLEKKLIETRLQTAEQQVTINELQRYKNTLTSDIEAIKAIQPSSVSKLQDEFLEGRIKEADVVLEFDKIKRTLAMLKHVVEEQLKETEKELAVASGDLFSIRFNLRDKYQEEIKRQEEVSLANTVILQDEVDHLKMQIKRLENVRNDINNQIYLNEELKVHLYSVRTSVYYRNKNINDELKASELKRIAYEETSKKELEAIQKNIENKTIQVSETLEKVDSLQTKNEKNGKLNEHILETMSLEIMGHLEGEIERLQKEIQLLSLSSICDKKVTVENENNNKLESPV